MKTITFHPDWEPKHLRGRAVAPAPAREAYVCSNFFSNCWLIFGKLCEARSRLYRRRFLQVNTSTRVKALDEIYKIYTPLHLGNLKEKPWKALRASVLRTLHRSEFKNSAKCRQPLSHFWNFMFEISFFFAIVQPLVQDSPILTKKIPEFQQFLRKGSKSPRF